jgi:hypothetical protein
MIEELTRAQYDFALFATRCFADRGAGGQIRRLIICLPPRHLKSSASAMPRISPTSSPAIAAAS